MAIKFNLSGLKKAYFDALHREDPTLLLEVAQGRGLFLFMMSFSEEDEASRDRLFILLRRTQCLLPLKLYGSHRQGNFFVYLDEDHEQAFVEELELRPSHDHFQFERFLNQLNAAIPEAVPLGKKIDAFRVAWPELKRHGISIVDDADKTILIGVKRLPADGQVPFVL